MSLEIMVLNTLVFSNVSMNATSPKPASRGSKKNVGSAKNALVISGTLKILVTMRQTYMYKRELSKNVKFLCKVVNTFNAKLNPLEDFSFTVNLFMVLLNFLKLLLSLTIICVNQTSISSGFQW